MSPWNVFSRIILAVLVVLSLKSANAQSLEPSATSCQFYRDLQSEYACPQSNYLQEAELLCEKYLKMEPELNEEIQGFFPGIRFCLQDRLREKLGSQFCANLHEISIESHVSCYTENGFCDLSLRSKFILAWITWKKVFTSPWRETGQRINQSCQHQID
ncbi:MAG: hypothetical protein IPM97_11370 [Bdellovibrionaceae bacterium]|nr:hypothetical protein [Pseudobdellovibrionaceae bacterium]